MFNIKKDLFEMFNNLTSEDEITLIYGVNYMGGDLLRSISLAGIEVYGFIENQDNPTLSEYHSLPVVSTLFFLTTTKNITVLCPQTNIDEEGIIKMFSSIADFHEKKLITIYLFDPNEIKGWGWLNYVEVLPPIYQKIYSSDTICSSRYLKELTTVVPIYLTGNSYHYNDYRSEYVNIIDGMRITIPANTNSKNSIHLMGQSFIFGYGCEDKDTISSYLQQQINQSHFAYINKYALFNHGIVGAEFNYMIEKICSLPLQRGDIVILTNSTFAVPFNKSYNENTFEENSLLYFHYIQKAKNYCDKHNAQMIVAKMPTTNDVLNPSEWEKLNVKLNFQKEYELQKIIVKTEGNKTLLSVDWDIIGMLCELNQIPFLNLQNKFSRPHGYGELFLDWSHLGPKGNKLIAQILYQFFFLPQTTAAYSSQISKLANQIDKSYTKQINLELKQYLTFLRKTSKDKPKNAGVIIINGNPFTLGHRYLIEKSLQSVPHLYILVLEEDKSDFSFKERLDLICQGTADLKNVSVLSSGKFIISSTTFPEYFQKDAKKNEVIDASTDIDLFGKYIAPALQVTKRFVGDEPYCNVTNQYNQQMKRLLPSYGIELVIFSRLTTNEIAISASMVRKLLNEKNFEILQEYLPKTTYEYIISSPKWNSVTKIINN